MGVSCDNFFGHLTVTFAHKMIGAMLIFEYDMKSLYVEKHVGVMFTLVFANFQYDWLGNFKNCQMCSPKWHRSDWPAGDLACYEYQPCSCGSWFCNVCLSDMWYFLACTTRRSCLCGTCHALRGDMYPLVWKPFTLQIEFMLSKDRDETTI